jgi:hypothetical protein
MRNKFANLEFGMKLAISILLILLCVGCGTTDRSANVEMAPHGKTISLPSIPVDGVSHTESVT